MGAEIMKELLLMLENLNDDIDKFFKRFSRRQPTERQQQNAIWIHNQKQKIIRYLNDNEMIVFFLLGLVILVGVGFLAVAVAS